MNKGQGTALIVGLCTIVCFTISAVVVVAVAVPEGANTGSLIALLLANLASTIPAVIAAAKIGSVQGDVGQVQAKVDDLGNGVMDSKIRAAVADVIGPDAVDPAARPQIARDRVKRAEHDSESEDVAAP